MGEKPFNSGKIHSIYQVYRSGLGPSSSHSIGPQRAARHFVSLMADKPAKIKIILYGSLASTGRGHFTDRVLKAELRDIPHEIVWDTERRDLPHPNTMEFQAFSSNGNLIRQWTVSSVGGGSLCDASGLVSENTAVRYPCRDISEALSQCCEKNISFWELVRQVEPSLPDDLSEVWTIMKESLQRGLARDSSALPGPLGLRRRAGSIYRKALNMENPQRDLAFLSAFALAVAEENASGAQIVAAPTCGSAGVLPGLLYYFEAIKGASSEMILRALATAGLFGAAIKANASISGAEVGCQGEIGSACSMAAAAGAFLLGGTALQIEYAAEIAMEHHLGLTCDPVEGYVQIPCIERNMTACLRAFESASFALLTDGRHLVSFDDAVRVMAETGFDLQSAYKETARGGLALLWKKKAPALKS